MFPDREALIEGALDTASLIASKSPIAVQGTKISLVYSRDHSVKEGLEHVVCKNTCKELLGYIFGVTFDSV